MQPPSAATRSLVMKDLGRDTKCQMKWFGVTWGWWLRLNSSWFLLIHSHHLGLANKAQLLAESSTPPPKQISFCLLSTSIPFFPRKSQSQDQHQSSERTLGTPGTVKTKRGLTIGNSEESVRLPKGRRSRFIL